MVLARQSTRTPSTFNASDDSAFAGLVDQHIIASKNALITVRPSTLNLTANCWATLDLQAVTYNDTTLDEALRLQYYANALRPALPSNITATSLIDLGEYWNAILELSATSAVLDGVRQQCNVTGGFALPELDFLANCSATGQFWWKEVFLASKFRPSSNDTWLPLLQSSLVPPYNAMSNSTISAIVATAQATNITLPNVLPGQVQNDFNNAAEACAPSACKALTYDGSSDLAGLGAVVAYGFIAGVTTLILVAALYMQLAANRENRHTRLRKDVARIFVLFWDTLVWFGLMACIAGLLYSSSYAQSLYEYTMSVLVVFLIMNAGVMLFLLYFLQDVGALDSSNMYDGVRILPQMAIWVLASSMVSSSLINSYFMDIHAVNYVDMPCYAADLWPLRYVIAASWFDLCILSIYLLYTIFYLCYRFAKFGKNKGMSSWQWLAQIDMNWYATMMNYVVISVASVALWVDFAFIIIIRNRARSDFGASYNDNSLGYGQIISAGFAAQALWTFFYRVFCHKFGHSIDRVSTWPLRLPRRPSADGRHEPLPDNDSSVEMTALKESHDDQSEQAY